MLKNHTRPWSTCRLPDGSGHRWHTPLHQQLLGETASQALFSPSRSVWFHFFPSGTCIFSKVDVNHFASPVMYHLIEAMNCCMTEAECTCIYTHTYTRTHTHVDSTGTIMYITSLCMKSVYIQWICCVFSVSSQNEGCCWCWDQFPVTPRCRSQYKTIYI